MKEQGKLSTNVIFESVLMLFTQNQNYQNMCMLAKITACCNNSIF